MGRTDSFGEAVYPANYPSDWEELPKNTKRVMTSTEADKGLIANHGNEK
jgi:hypothetical protein